MSKGNILQAIDRMMSEHQKLFGLMHDWVGLYYISSYQFIVTERIIDGTYHLGSLIPPFGGYCFWQSLWRMLLLRFLHEWPTHCRYIRPI